MAFLAPAAAGAAAAGTAATATGALASGAMLGSGLTAGAGMSSLLAPSLGATLGGGLGAGLGGAGLTAAGSMLAPGLGTAAGLGALAPAALTGLHASGAMLAPGLGATLPAAMGSVPAAAMNLGSSVGGLPMNAFPGLQQTSQAFSAEALKNAPFAPQAVSNTINPALQSMQNAAVSSPYSLTGKALTAPGESMLKATAESLPIKAAPVSPVVPGQDFLTNAMNLMQNPSMQGAKDYVKEHPFATAGAAYGINKLLTKEEKPPKQNVGMIRPYEFTRTQNPEAYAVSPTEDSSERQYFTDTFTPKEPYAAPGEEYKKAGGIARLAIGGPVEQMAALNAVGSNTGYPMSSINTPMYSNPMVQRPEATNVIAPSADAGVGAYTGEPKFAGGGISDLGFYSDGGRLLRGGGDGVSDSIPAVIGDKQPARLADGEFVVPARIVSELGNGSTEAGARKLYAMMDRVQKARSKSIGKDKVAVNSKADKHLPA